MKFPFSVPHRTGDELRYVESAIASGHLAGDGAFSRRCAGLLESKTTALKAVMTSSCTDALEMSALLCDIKPGDEVIMPSYTFVSTASAFALRGASIVWCDIRPDTKNIDENLIEALVTPRTRAVVVVHYGGVACEMDAISALCRKHDLLLVEDAAHSIDCSYRGRPLGSFGDLATLSFHETKNIQCGEGGALLVNNGELLARAKVLRDKGTNRSRFLEGEVDRYTWVELGSSFLMSELQAAFLLAQLETSTRTNDRRRALADRYASRLRDFFRRDQLPQPPSHCRDNGHIFYVVFDTVDERVAMARALQEEGIATHFHYQPLHEAPVWKGRNSHLDLPVTRRVSDGLLRLPLYSSLSAEQVDLVCEAVARHASRRPMEAPSRSLDLDPHHS